MTEDEIKIPIELLTYLQCCYTNDKTYTREEVYLVAERSVRKAINNILTQEHTKISEVINSEIDTVKLF